MFAERYSEGSGHFFIYFNNLFQTDDTHVPLILFSFGLKAEILMGYCIHMSTDEGKSSQTVNSRVCSLAGLQLAYKETKDFVLNHPKLFD